MSNLWEQEVLWFQHWFQFLATNAMQEAHLPDLFNEDKVAIKSERLYCVTSLHQQEQFPLLYVHKGLSRLLNQRLFMDMTFLLRTHYEGITQETYWLNMLRAAMEPAYVCHKTGTVAHFQRQESRQKITDKKTREVAIDYSVRIVLNAKS